MPSGSAKSRSRKRAGRGVVGKEPGRARTRRSPSHARDGVPRGLRPAPRHARALGGGRARRAEGGPAVRVPASRGGVALLILGSPTLSQRRAQKALEVPGTAAWSRRGTPAWGPGGDGAQTWSGGAHLGAGPRRCSVWSRRPRTAPLSASGRYPTNAFPSVPNQILIVKLNILSVPLAPLSL